MKLGIPTLLLLGAGAVLAYVLYARLNPGVEYPLGYIEQQGRTVRAYPAKITSCDGLCFLNPRGEKCRVCRAKALAIMQKNRLWELGQDNTLMTPSPMGALPGSDPLHPRRGLNEACEYDKTGKLIWCKYTRIPGGALEYPDLRQDETQFHVRSSHDIDPAEADRNKQDFQDEITPQAAFAYSAEYGRDFYG